MRRLIALTLALAACALGAPPAPAQPLYGADGAQGNPSNLYTLDPATGAVTSVIGPIGFALTGLAVHPITRVLYGSTANADAVAPRSLIVVDKATGAGTLVGPYNLGQFNTLADLTFTSDGTLYGWSTMNGLHVVDLDTGAAVKIGDGTPPDGVTFGGGLAADGGDNLFLAPSLNTGPLFLVDRVTGDLTEVVQLTGASGESIAAMAFAPDGTLLGALLIGTVPVRTAQLVRISPQNGNVVPLGQSVDRLDALAFDVGPALAAAVLPASRAVPVGATATAFATIIATGTTTATGCGIAPAIGLPGPFVYQTTDPATNQLTGTPNTPVDIPGGGSQTFVIGFTPTAPLGSTDVPLSFDCSDTAPAPIISGVNTLLLTATAGPTPDLVALGVTPTGDGIVNIPGPTGTGVLAVATSNVGAGALIVASADTGDVALPVSIRLCQTDPGTGQCLAPPAPSVTTQIDAGATPTFAVFIEGSGVVPFSPGANRVIVRFTSGGTTVGATTAALRTS